MARLESQQFSIIGRPRGAYLSRSNMPEGTLSMPWRARGAAVRGIGDALSSLGNAYLNMRLNTRRKNGSLMLAEYQARCNDYLNALGANPERYDVDGAEKFAQWRSDLWATLAEKYEKEGGYDHDDVHRRRDILNIGYQSDTDKAVFRQGRKDEMKSTQTEWMESQATYEATGNPDALRLAAAAMDRYNEAKDGFINLARFEAITQEAREKGTVTTGGRTFRIVKDEKEAQEAEKNHEPHVTEESLNQWSGGTAQRLDTRRKMVAAETGSAVARRIDKLIKAGQLDQARQELDEAKNQSGNWAGIEIPDHVLKTAEDTLSRQEKIRDAEQRALFDIENSLQGYYEGEDDGGLLRKETANGRYATPERTEQLLDMVDKAEKQAAESGKEEDAVYARLLRANVNKYLARCKQNLEMDIARGLEVFYPGTGENPVASVRTREGYLSLLDQDQPLYKALKSRHRKQCELELQAANKRQEALGKKLATAKKEEAREYEEQQENDGYACSVELALGRAEIPQNGGMRKVDLGDDAQVMRFFNIRGVDVETARKYMKQLRSSSTLDAALAQKASRLVANRYGLREDGKHDMQDFLLKRCKGLLTQCRTSLTGVELQTPKGSKQTLGDATSATIEHNLRSLFDVLDNETEGKAAKWIRKEWKAFTKDKDNRLNYDDFMGESVDGPTGLAIRNGILTIVKNTMYQRLGEFDSQGGEDE